MESKIAEFEAIISQLRSEKDKLQIQNLFLRLYFENNEIEKNNQSQQAEFADIVNDIRPHCQFIRENKHLISFIKCENTTAPMDVKNPTGPNFNPGEIVRTNVKNMNGLELVKTFYSENPHLRLVDLHFITNDSNVVNNKYLHDKIVQIIKYKLK